MLYTFKFLGINTENALQVLPNDFGKYENIFTNDPKDVIHDILGEAGKINAKRGKMFVGFLIDLDNRVTIVVVDMENERIGTASDNYDINVIPFALEDFKADCCGVIQQIDQNEYRIVTDTVYEFQGKFL